MSTTDPLRLLRLVVSIVLAVAVGLPARVVAATPPTAAESKSKSKEPKDKSSADEGDKAASKSKAEPAAKPEAAEAKGDAKPEGGAEPPKETSAPATVDGALEQGDYSTALQRARAERKAKPTAANWHQEAQILEQMGDYAGAKKAYRSELDALGDEPKRKAAVREDLQRVEAKSRGTVPSEPKSTHRRELDERRAGAPEPSKRAAKKVADLPKARGKSDRIITKWYFWVTVAAIVASAAAVTGIAIKASRDDKKDALDLTRQPTQLGPTIIRF